jgi:hypothetical protein
MSRNYYFKHIVILKELRMIKKMLIVVIMSTLVAVSFAEETAKNESKSETKAKASSASDVVQEQKEVEADLTLPEKDTMEYWVVRSQAMTEFIPFLTNKRAEVKKKRIMLADYLLKIEKAGDFAGLDMPIVYDPKIYADILQIGQAFEEMNVEIPKKRPSWDTLVELVMQHVIFEGYWPTEIEEGDEAKTYIDICKKKEKYGQKVRKDLRSILDQTAKMWVYLEKIEKLGGFKAYAANLILEEKARKAAERAQYIENRRQARLDRREWEAELRDDRREFRYTRGQRHYESRQENRRFRQSRLDDRFVRSGSYYH